MEYGAIDLHLRRSEFRVVDAEGEVVLEGKFNTTREALTQIFGRRAPLRVLIESSTESEWVAQHLEGLGHAVVVADPNYLPMYGSRRRKVKTDHRDTAALAEANRLGIFRRAHRVSAAQRARRQTLRVRRHLVQMRSRGVNVLRAVLRQEGWRLPSGSVEAVEARLQRLAVPAPLAAIVAPLGEALRALNGIIQAADRWVAAEAHQDPVAQRLMTAPGVGPVVALTFRAVLDDLARFGHDPGRVSAFLGLVPSEYSSSDRQRKGHITKTGPRELRPLLVQASWTIWRGRHRAGGGLRDWARRVAARRGRRIAIVALARRLSRILVALWRDGTCFAERRHAPVVAA